MINEMNVEATLILLHKLLFFAVWKKTKLLVDCDELQLLISNFFFQVSQLVKGTFLT